MSDKHYIGLDVTSFEKTGKHKPVSRVTLFLDSENYYTAGDDTGKEITANCPSATQAIADALLAKFKGYEHQSFNADAANIDPAAELGDGVTVGGIYATLSRLKDDGNGYAGVGAADEPELEEEYPYVSPIQQEIKRQSTEIYSVISKTAEEIRLEVEDELNNLSASFSVSLESITAKVQGLDAAYTELSVTVDGVTVTDASGTTRIKGSSVETETLKVSAANITGTLTASQIDASSLKVSAANITGTLTADQINLTGAISWSDLSTAVQGDIDEAWEMAYDAQSAVGDVADTVDSWAYTYGGKTYIDGEMLMTGTVRASTLEGGEVSILTSAEREAGYITATGATTATYAITIESNGALDLYAGTGDVYLEDGDGEYLHISTGDAAVVIGNADLIPNRNGLYDLGGSSHLWNDAYLKNEPTVSSDMNKKHDIVYGLERFDGFFDDLKPMSFVFDENTSGRTHTGLGAQDVEQNLLDHGFTTLDFAGLIKSPQKGEDGNLIDGEYDYGLRYGEFIALCIDQIQRLKMRVAQLEAKA